MQDRTRSKEESQSLINDVIADAVRFCIEEYGYTEAEAWEKVSDMVAFELEDPLNADYLRPPSLEREMEIASIMAQIKMIGLGEQAI